MQFKSILTTSCVFGVAAVAATADDRPNIVFILTDDQDAHMTTFEYMPSVQKHIIDKGTMFERHYCTVSLCCPSRVNIWTGQLAHNTNVTSVSPPYGGYPKFAENGYNEKNIALWMQESGYNTYYTGKLYNALDIDNYNDPPVKGYTENELLLDPYTYQYYNISSSRNGQEPEEILDKYSPDFTAETAYEFLELGLGDSEKPFFLTVAPIAPHAEGHGSSAQPPGVADRHKDLFPDYQIPRGDNFNPDNPSGVAWVANLAQLNETVIDFNDMYQRRRLQALQAVDEMVEELIRRLDEAGVLDNTHIFYSADNGYHISQHRLHPGKMLGMEEDIRVPLIWRGPDVPEGQSVMFPTSHSDLAPTLMKIAGLSIDDREFDGVPLELTDTTEPRSEHVGVEYWGAATAESAYGIQPNAPIGAYYPNTYKGLRLEAEDYGYYYSVWCTDESELYDMKADPAQLNNLMKLEQQDTEDTCMGRPQTQLINRLDAMLLVLKGCKETTCTRPWESLHPEGNIHTLADAMDPSFDDFYESQPKVSYDLCLPGYYPELEGPQDWNVYGEVPASKRGLVDGYDWSFWE